MGAKQPFTDSANTFLLYARHFTIDNVNCFFYRDYISSDIINKHCNEQKLLRWFHYFISILEYKIHYTSRTVIHLHYLLTHSTAPLSRCTSEKWNRSKRDKQKEVRSGVSPRYSGDMQHVPCQRGVTLL